MVTCGINAIGHVVYTHVVVHYKMTKTSDIFHIAESADKVVCPPDQVFKNRDFEFLLTAGGHLVVDDSEYSDFMKFLKEIGETEFTVKENIGATLTERNSAFEATFSVNSDLKDFDAKIREFDEHFGMMILHWFVYGQNKKWGIYIAEFPTVNIIGCTSELADNFRKVFKIEGNGYEQESELLLNELKLMKDPKDRKRFFENYKIKNAPKQLLL